MTDSPLSKLMHLFGRSRSRERSKSGRIPPAPYHAPTRGLRAEEGDGAGRVFGVRFCALCSLRDGGTDSVRSR